MLLASFLLPALSLLPPPTDPVEPAFDPRVLDLSYTPAELAAPPPYEPQVRDDWDRGRVTVRPYMPWYFGVHGGFTTTRTSSDQDVELDFDDGYLVGLALGYRFGQPAMRAASWAAELEVLWTDQDLDATGAGPINLQASTDMSVLALYLNAIFDFLFTERFGAYAGAGLGLAWTDIGTLQDADGPWDFRDESGPFLTWQLRAGIQWLFGERGTVRLGYRFLNIDDVELDDAFTDASFDLETRQHVIELGLLWGF